MGFLNSIFGGKKEEKQQAGEDNWKKIYQRLEAVGVTRDGCLNLAEALTNSNKESLHLYCYERKFFPDFEIAETAFKVIQPFLEKEPIPALSLEGFKPDDGVTLFGKNNLKTEKFVIKNCSFEKSDWEQLSSNMAQDYVKEAVFDDISKKKNPATKDEEIPFLKGLMNCRNLESLTIKDCEARDNEFSELAKGMIKNSCLKKLDLSKNYARDNGLIDVIKALPDSLEVFSLASTPMGEKCSGFSIIETLSQRIKTMPNLKVLDLNDCLLGTKDLECLLPGLPSSLETLNLKNNMFMDDEALKILGTYLRKPDCNLKTTNIADSWRSHFSAENIEAVEQAEQANKNAALSGVQKVKAAEIAKIKGEKTAEEKINEASGEEVKDMLHSALQSGVIDIAFKKMTASGIVLTPKELEAKNTDGKTFVQACSDMKKTPALMQPELYNNAKVYQTTYDSLVDGDKSYFDGQGNHPSFAKMKNQVMANAVKSAIAGKTKQGR